MNSSCGIVKRRLEGKVAIVTGGASGIGASTVHLFHGHGAKVVIADIQDKLGHAIVEKLGPDDVIYVHCDVSEEDQIVNLIDATVSKFGRLDIMFNNAGIMDGHSDSILNTKKQSLERMVGVNLVGGLMGAKHAARIMVPNKSGCILFTASACTQIAGIASHSYAATKYGIAGVTKSLAAELGQHGIRVNCISPFGVLTGTDVLDERRKESFAGLMGAAGNLKGKILEAEDIAKAALFLASDEAGYVSGMNLVVDGGYSIVNPTLKNFVSLSLTN